MTATVDPHDSLRPISWQGDHLRLLDQRRLPGEVGYLACRSVEEVAAAIHDLAVRGAPAIGIAGAWGMVLAARHAHARGETGIEVLAAPARTLVAARPTAVNLAWAVQRMLDCARGHGLLDPAALTEQAAAIETEDLAANRRMGELGAGLIAPGSGVLTHCNTGSLATAGFGTALGVIRAAWAQGLIAQVHATETRPWLQGARLTVWELAQDRIPATLLVDSAAAHLMASGAVHWLIVGADRIAANGDVANKIGTLQLAIAARHFGVKVMVVAPSSTVDLAMADGAGIEIELRDPSEVTRVAGQATAAPDVRAWNPVFDVTPAGLVDAIVTERGVVRDPKPGDLAALLEATR
ncbi:MAG: S-methyl-5-thioribose-1-phosphate isomerase [Xanthomonadales bacterium]|nr:S-methyl-5-thioribose-1-phosphate isomerase [Xanthomonadales bacterium]